MPIISAVGLYCYDRIEETPNEKVSNMSKNFEKIDFDWCNVQWNKVERIIRLLSAADIISIFTKKDWLIFWIILMIFTLVFWQCWTHIETCVLVLNQTRAWETFAQEKSNAQPIWRPLKYHSKINVPNTW